jgi:3-isopropylmalate dehydrogenase
VKIMLRIAVIPGDGIGPDVTAEAKKVLQAVADCLGKRVESVDFDYGAERYLKDGVTLPPDALVRFRNEFDAIFLGALGDPRVPDMKHATEILYAIRFGLDLYANIRPVKLLDRRLTPLKNTIESDVDFTIIRENTEDFYTGIGGSVKKGTPDEIAIQESVSTRKGVERIIEAAFSFATNNLLKKVTMTDRGNILRFDGDLWQRTFWNAAKRFPQIQCEHLYIDALAMMLLKNPGRFEVIVAGNMFGDILGDMGAELQGGLGMAPSGNMKPEGICMFEPVHGSAPKYARLNVANPMGAILSVQMMLEHLGWKEAGSRIESAVRECIREGECTRDLGGRLGTREVGDAICARIKTSAP